jgi:hypothetical protein
MTMAPAIANLAATDVAFKNWLESQQQALDVASDGLIKDVSARATDFIAKGGWKDAKRVANGVNAEIILSKTWSLDRIDKIIDDTVGKLLSGQSPQQPDPPIGGTNVTTTPLPDAAASVLAGQKGAIALAVKGLVQSVLSEASSSVNASTGSSYGTVEPGPGLFFFNAVIESSYARKEFFNGETILQLVFVFECWFSQSRLHDLGVYDFIQSCMKIATIADDDINKVNAKIASLDPSADDYDAKYAKYQAILQALSGTRGSALAKAAELRQPPASST